MLKMNEMPYVIGITMRLYPSNTQKDIIAYNDGAARFIYNRLVARHQELFSLRKVKVFMKPVADRIAYLESLGENSSDFKANYPFLEDKRIDAQMIANAIRNYRIAWHNFSTKPGTSIPTFHKKGYDKRYQTNAHYPKEASVVSDGNVYLTDKCHIQLPKLGTVRFAGSERIRKIFMRTSETRIGTIKISMDACGRYYASLQVGSVEAFFKPVMKTGNHIGIDVNIENFCTMSDGTVIENPKYRTHTQHKLSKQQRKLSHRAERARTEDRSLRTSKNYQKQRFKVAYLYQKASAQNNNFQHVLTKHIIESQDIVVVEDLQIKNLMKNHRLAKAIADCSWGSFIQRLDYKARAYGKMLVRVSPKNTTQTCSVCGFILTDDDKLTLHDREWVCPLCGTHHIRDLNAAINIMNRGLAALAI
jgi:putative transposase